MNTLPTRHRLAALGLLMLLAACAQPPQAPAPAEAAAPVVAPPPPPPPAPPPPPPEPPPVSVVELSNQPAQRALLQGIRAYEEGKYRLAETRLNAALKAGLDAPADLAAAHKTLAFVYCTSQRIKQCENAFRAARAAQPGFALSKAEAGHPTWGPVYRRIAR